MIIPKYTLDIILFFLISVSITWVLTVFSSSIFYFLFGTIFVVYRIVGSSVIPRREIRDNSDERKEIWKTPHLNWFVITKFLSVIIGIISIIYSRLSNTYTSFSHSINALLLIVNITEAIVSDIHSAFQSVSAKIPHAINALSGFLLVLTVPDIPTLDVIIELDIKVKSTELFIFPLSTMWIVAYTIWNATFSYGFGFSMTTRLMLITAILVSHFILRTPSAWLGSRCFSLMLNMVLRASNATYLYTPGKSILTHKICPTYSRIWFLLYSISSLVISMITFYFYSNDSVLLTFFL